MSVSYSNPVPVMTMLEVIYTEETSQEAIDIMCMVGDAQDKAISLVRDMPGTYGFILNRVFAAAFREGAKIVQDGIATREVSPTIPPSHKPLPSHAAVSPYASLTLSRRCLIWSPAHLRRTWTRR